MSTLNSIEDINLAERLLKLHGWADMVNLHVQVVRRTL